MKIRNRTLIILGVTFIVLFAFLFLTTEQIMANSFGELEDKEVKKNIERATAAIDTNIDSLATTATDWGHWDDTYYFIKGEYEDYPENNLDIDSLVNLQTNMMLFYDATGQIHYVVGVDLDNYEYTEVPAAVIENISSYEMLFSKNSQPSYASGMINTPEGVLLIASNPITRSTEREVITGTLIVARYLDEALVQELEQTTSLSLDTHTFNIENSGLTTSKSYSASAMDNNLSIDRVSATSIIGTTVLNDVNDNPLLLLDVEMERDIYQYGESAINHIFISILSIALACGIVLTVSIDRFMLSRLFTLKDNLTWITAQGSLSSRVKISGTDELKDLADNINYMLESLENNEIQFQLAEKENQERMETVLSSIICGTLLIDAETLFITDVNPTATEIIGLPKDKIVGNVCSNFFYPLKKEECATLHSGMVVNKSESILLNADGKEVPVLISIVPVSLYDKSYLVESFVDMTRIKEAEKGLIESEEKFSKLSTSAQDAIVMVDNNSAVTFWNPAAEKIFGYTREEVMGKDLNELVAPLGYEDKHTEGFSEFKTEGKGSADGQLFSVNSRKKDGTEFPVEVSLSRFKLKNGSWNTVAIIRDVTDRKKFEEALMDAKVIAEMANRAKSEFLATMSHELRTPLNSIIGFSDLMLGGSVGDMADMQKKFLGNISTSGKHLLSLINNVLDLSKIEAGKMELNYELFGIYATIDEVKQLVSPLADKKALKMEYSKDESLEKIYADRIRFKQILFNLTSNAIKFTPQGGKITISAIKVQNKAQFSVKDTGIGISEENKRKLFQPFTQLDSTTTRKYEGTGLGLSLVKRFVEMHKGKIWAESEMGKGTTFIFELPLEPDSNAKVTTKVETLPDQVSTESAVDAPEPKKSIPNAMELSPSKGYGTLILVVEDDDPSRELLEVTLTHEGYRVASAKNGKEALELAEKMKPFAITLDIMMPGMSGWDVLKELKEKNDTKKIPVIITTMLEERELGIVWGAVDHLIKPIKKEVLLSALERSKEKIIRSPLRVLVVDDEKNAVELITAMLNAEGFDTLSAYGGKEAIDIALEKQPDIVILDLMMPDISGFDVIKILKSKPETIDIPIIICTAKDLDSSDMSSLNDNVSSIVQKGMFTKEKLIELMKAIQERNN